jgi:hypothetical protein
MSITELKESIIQKIHHINDEELLDYLNQLLGRKEEQKVYKLSELEKNMLAESHADYLAGRTKSNELQQMIYNKLLSVDNEELISNLITLVDKSDFSIYQTSDEQKAKILEGHKQLSEGNCYSNEQVEKEIDEWLSKE